MDFNKKLTTTQRVTYAVTFISAVILWIYMIFSFLIALIGG
jgi:hypothetical protein